MHYTEGAANDLVAQFDDAREGVCSRRDGRTAWRALVAKYELTGNLQKAALHAELDRAALGDGEDPDVYFVKIERIQRQLRRMNAAVDDTMMWALL